MCVHSFIYSNCTLYVVLEWKIHHEEFATYSTFMFYKSVKDMPVPFFPTVPLIISTYRLGSFLPLFRCFQIRIPEKSGVATPPSRIFPLVPSSLSCRTLLGGTPWWNAVGLDCAGSGPSRASTRTGPGEGRPPHQLTCSKENSPHELSKRFGTKSTQQKNSSPVLHMNSLNGVSALVGTTSTLVSHMSRDLSRDCVAKHISFFW